MSSLSCSKIKYFKFLSFVNTYSTNVFLLPKILWNLNVLRHFDFGIRICKSVLLSSRLMTSITVQETNDSSILSKASIVNLGYFDDPYLKLFTSKVVRRAPLIHYGYYVRAKTIDYILTNFLSLYSSYQNIQIFSLGAGFDSAYFRLKSRNLLNNCRYIEVDFQGVVRRKIKIIEKHDTLERLILDNEKLELSLKSNDYSIIACDLTDIEKLSQHFHDHKIRFDIPTLFVSECVLTYVEYNRCQNLLKYFAEHFSHVILSIYEQILPNDGFGKVMLKHFNKIQSPLKRIDKLHDITGHQNELERVGFENTVAFDMNDFFRLFICEAEKRRIFELEVFDEFEEWHLKCKHYVIVTGFKGIDEDVIHKLFPQKPIVKEKHNSLVTSLNQIKISLQCEVDFQRFAHTCAQIDDQVFLITGGIGVAMNKTHEMMNDACLLFIQNKKLNFEKVFVPNFSLKRLYHSCTPIGSGKIFIYGGRQSPLKPCLEHYLGELNSDRELILHEVPSTSMTSRWRHAAAYLNGSVYIFGGRGKDGFAMNDLWSFNISTKTWSEKKLSLKVKGRHSHSMVAHENRLIVYGGLTSKMEILSECLLIDIKEDKDVFPLSHLNTNEYLPGRYSHSCHVINDALVIIGGIDIQSEHDYSIISISLKDSTWKCFDITTNVREPLLIHNHTSIMLSDASTLYHPSEDDDVIVLGGGGNCFSFGTHFNKSPFFIDCGNIR